MTTVWEKVWCYIGVLVGAYLVIVGSALGARTRWWTPLVWVSIWVLAELFFWLVRSPNSRRRT